MKTTPHEPAVRRLVRAVTLVTGAGAILVPALLAGPASAQPEGWSDPEDVNTLHALALLVGIPVALFLLIALAVYLPALARGEKVTPGEPENEWFGGPRQGVEAADKVDVKELGSSQTGGASGRW